MPNSVQQFLKFLDRVCLWSAYLAAFFLCILVILGTVEIFGRNIFDISISFSVEYTGYLVAAVLLLGSGEALKDETHVRVSLLEERLKGNVRAMVLLLSLMLGLVIAGYWGFAAIRFAYDTWFVGTVSYFPSQTPLWIPQALIAFGPVVLLCGLLAKCLRLIWGKDTREGVV